MRIPIRLALAVTAALLMTRPLVGQITSNPIPEAIQKRGLAVQIKDVVRLPDTGAHTGRTLRDAVGDMSDGHTRPAR